MLVKESTGVFQSQRDQLNSVGIRAGMNNYIHAKQSNVIILPCRDFNGGLVKTLLKSIDELLYPK